MIITKSPPRSALAKRLKPFAAFASWHASVHSAKVWLLAPAQAGIAVGEYAPNAVKKAIVGVGHAQKQQVEHMVRLTLPGVALAGPDAADALAIAICHARHLQSRSLRIKVVA